MHGINSALRKTLHMCEIPDAVTRDNDLQAVKLTAWLEHKLRVTLQKNMVFPACTDVRLAFLLNVWQLDTPAEVPLELPTPPPPKDDGSTREVDPVLNEAVARTALEEVCTLCLVYHVARVTVI
jgi:hypothetical protein